MVEEKRLWTELFKNIVLEASKKETEHSLLFDSDSHTNGTGKMKYINNNSVWIGSDRLKIKIHIAISSKQLNLYNNNIYIYIYKL